MNKSRVNELVTSMKSFSKEKYYKGEMLSELFLLQQEIVDLTFNDVHASTADLKIWDVERHLKQMNQDNGNVADEELERFLKGSRELCNLIKAEVSGNRGEAKAFRALEHLQNRSIVIKNVELKDGDVRTELDAVVITSGSITIVEVKNTGKDIFIDENGNYFRTGEYLKLDCNIAEKMDLKENLLRKALAVGDDQTIKITRVVVFTNNRIEVQNKYSGIQTCFVTQLTTFVEKLIDSECMSYQEMEQIASRIREAEEKEAYPSRFDVEQYKRDFATVMAILEEASSVTEESLPEKEVVREKRNSILEMVKRGRIPRYARHMGGVAAAAVLTFTTLTTIELIEKGVLR